MRTDVKIGIALGAIVLIIAVSYYGTKKEPDIQFASADQKIKDQNATTLDKLLSPKQKQPRPSTTSKAHKLPVGSRSRSMPDKRRPANVSTDRSTKTTAVTGKPVPAHNNAKASRTPPALPVQSLSKRTEAAASKDLPKRKTQTGQSMLLVNPPRTDFLSQPPSDHKNVTAKQVKTEPVTSEKSKTASAKPLESAATPDKIEPQTRKRANPPRTARKPVRTHTVEAGDSFARLAEKYLGSQKFARYLADANPTVDPYRMLIGTSITIPPQPAAVAGSRKPGMNRRTAGPGEYVVQAGDSLYSISEKHLGSGNRWPEVAELNKTKLGNDPTMLRVGQILKLPSR